MEKDVTNNMSYYLLTNAANKDDLGNIRPWNNVKVGIEGNDIWLKDLDYAQIHSLEVKSIPYKTLFYAKEGKLFLLHSQLPDRTIPSLLWTVINRALPIKLPTLNHHFFGITEKIKVNLIPSETEREAMAMMTSISDLQQYIENTAAIRLQQIQWTIVDKENVLLIGKPLLPIKGSTFWQRNTHLIPTGFDFDLHILAEEMQRLLNPQQEGWIVWDKDSSYFLVKKTDLESLSISSFRLSMKAFL
jgi:MoxR-vWA-beta-propeller ternary system domain bpX2